MEFSVNTVLLRLGGPFWRRNLGWPLTAYLAPFGSDSEAEIPLQLLPGYWQKISPGNGGYSQRRRLWRYPIWRMAVTNLLRFSCY